MDKETVQIIADIIKTVGFPVAVATYVLWRLDTLILNTLAVVNEIAVLLKNHLETSKQQAESQAAETKKNQEQTGDLLDISKEIAIRLSVKGTDK